MPRLIKMHTSTPHLIACKLSFTDRTGGRHAHVRTTLSREHNREVTGHILGRSWASVARVWQERVKSLGGAGAPCSRMAEVLQRTGGRCQCSKMSQPLGEAGAVGTCLPSTTQGTRGSTHPLERGLLGATTCRCPGGDGPPFASRLQSTRGSPPGPQGS